MRQLCTVTEPRGPVYLCLPREVLANDAVPMRRDNVRPLGTEPPAPSQKAIEAAAAMLANTCNGCHGATYQPWGANTQGNYTPGTLSNYTNWKTATWTSATSMMPWICIPGAISTKSEATKGTGK